MFASIRFKTFFAYAIFIFSIAIDSPTISWAVYPEGDTLDLADGRAISFEELFETSERLRTISETLAAQKSDWDETTETLFAEVDKMVSHANSKIEMFVKPIGSIIGGAIRNLTNPIPIIGPTIGDILQQYFISNLTARIERFYEDMHHEARTQTDLNQFIDNWKAYRELNALIEKTESQINATYPLIKLIQNSGGRSTLIIHLDRLREHFSGIQTHLRQIILSLSQRRNQLTFSLVSRPSKNWLGGLEMGAATIRGFKRQSDSIINHLEDSTDALLCHELHHGIASLIELEQNRIIKRKKLINESGQRGQQTWIEVVEKTYLENMENSSIATALAENQSRQIALVEEHYQGRLQADSEIQKYLKTSMEQCLSEQMGSSLIPTQLAYSATRSECHRQISDPTSKWAQALPQDVHEKMTHYFDEKNQEFEEINQRTEHLLAESQKMGSPSRDFYRETKKNYLNYFDQLIADQSQEALRKRQQELEQRRNEIRAVCPFS